jgi:8-oxo-dGTP diphosphatase
MFKYTLCFVKQNNNLLLLNRDFAPTKGLWNGVGGKIEENETPIECVIRETFEETGIELFNIQYKGIVTWDVDGSYSGGMYTFLAELPQEYVYLTPSKIDEGVLDWKSIDWILSDGNFGVGEMIPQFLPALLNNEGCYEHKCTLYNNKLTSYIAIPITHEVEFNYRER